MQLDTGGKVRTWGTNTVLFVVGLESPSKSSGGAELIQS
jgi:hypothetical protein